MAMTFKESFRNSFMKIKTSPFNQIKALLFIHMNLLESPALVIHLMFVPNPARHCVLELFVVYICMRLI